MLYKKKDIVLWNVKNLPILKRRIDDKYDEEYSKYRKSLFRCIYLDMCGTPEVQGKQILSFVTSKKTKFTNTFTLAITLIRRTSIKDTHYYDFYIDLINKLEEHFEKLHYTFTLVYEIEYKVTSNMHFSIFRCEKKISRILETKENQIKELQTKNQELQSKNEELQTENQEFQNEKEELNYKLKDLFKHFKQLQIKT